MDNIISIEGTTDIGEIKYVRTTKPDLNAYAARKREHFNDVTITCGVVSIPANKMVLACNSLYFEAAFDIPMKERYSGSVEVERIDATSMRSVIDYIYNGEVKINVTNVCKLLDAAEYLQIENLKDKCITYLQNAVTCQNCFSFRLLADRYHSDKLSDDVKSFMRDNFSEILSRDEFKKLKERDFCFLYSVCTNIDKTTLYKAVVEWIKFKFDERKDRFLEVLEKVDLKLYELSLQFLNNVVVQEEFIRENKAYMKAVSDAMKVLSTKENLLIIGGDDGYNKVTQYNIPSNKFTQLQKLPEGKRSHRCVTFNDFVYVIGGLADDGKTSLATVYRMNIKGNPPTWEQVKSMTIVRDTAGAAVLNGLIFVTGGFLLPNTLSSGEYYLETLNIWNKIADMKSRRYGHELVELKSYLYAIGGYDGNEITKTVEKYNPKENEWGFTASLQTARKWFVATATDDAIYVMGGHDGKKRLTSIEKYDVIGNVWTNLTDMIIERAAFSGCLIQNKIYIVGGVNNDPQVVESIHKYDIEKDNWVIVTNTEEKYHNHTVVPF